jgi:phosphohistidine phosphatase
MPHIHAYLVRHEEAEPGYDIPDANRALTGKGRSRMRATGKMVLQHAAIDLIYTSPLVRAVQTAEILIGALGIDEPMYARDEIAAPPSLRSIIDLIDAAPADVRGVAVVGHEPTLSELSAEMLGLDAFPRAFKKGMVLALDWDRHARRAKFRWLILGKGPTLSHRLEE